MFGSKEKKVENFETRSSNSDSGVTCVISEGTIVDGKIHAKENIRIDGTVKGEILCDRKIVMGDSGFIKGNVKTEQMTIRGRIEGDIIVTDLLTLQSSARIVGNIIAKAMMVESGALYDGTCKVG